MANISVRRLNENDWQIWKRIRLESLSNTPDAFAGCIEEEELLPDEHFKNTLTRETVFGAFAGEDLIGVAGFSVFVIKKLKHRGKLWGTYVQPSQRGKGIADLLIQTVIAEAKTRVRQLYCGVVTTNPQAAKLYEKNGFKIYATEQDSLHADGIYHDEHLMVLSFASE